MVGQILVVQPGMTAWKVVLVAGIHKEHEEFGVFDGGGE